MRLEPISPSAIVIQPPEKLVIEVRAHGRYHSIYWKRQGHSGFNPPAEYFVHFNETYVVENTSVEDLGEYIVTVNPSIGLRRPDRIQFTVNARMSKS